MSNDQRPRPSITMSSLLPYVVGAVYLLLAVHLPAGPGTTAPQAVPSAPVAAATATSPTAPPMPAALDAPDTADEGADAVVVDCHADGEDGNAAMFCHDAAAEGWHGDPRDRCECLRLLTGTVVNFPGGLWLVTLDGVAACDDGLTLRGQECSPDGPVLLTGVPVYSSTHEVPSHHSKKSAHTA